MQFSTPRNLALKACYAHSGVYHCPRTPKAWRGGKRGARDNGVKGKTASALCAMPDSIPRLGKAVEGNRTTGKGIELRKMRCYLGLSLCISLCWCHLVGGNRRSEGHKGSDGGCPGKLSGLSWRSLGVGRLATLRN